MIYNEGVAVKYTDPTKECYKYMMEFNLEINEVNKLLTEAKITLGAAKFRGVLNEASSKAVSTEVGNEAYNKLLNIVKAFGKFVVKVLKDFISWVKSLIFTDNSDLLAWNEAEYNSIHTDVLSDMRYGWREPSQKLKDFIFGTSKESEDLNAIWKVAFDYTAIAYDRNSSFDKPVGDVIKDMTGALLGGVGSSDVEIFREKYSYSLLDQARTEIGMSVERKELIKNSMVSRKLIVALESTMKGQQNNVAKFAAELEKHKSQTEGDRLAVVTACSSAVNALNTIATITVNSLIQAIKVYEGQCRKVFQMIIRHANWHGDNA